MKKIKKILLSMLMLSLFILLINANEVMGTTTIKGMEDSAAAFISKGETGSGNLKPVTDAVTGEFTGLGQILTMIGAGVMVATTAYMGIKYMVSPPDKQAALKQQLVGLVVAGIVIFGAYGIWKAVIGVVSNF